VTVHLDLSADVRPVKGDSIQLQQVILNLMLNAFSAMSDTGPTACDGSCAHEFD
jgi:two-component system sensor kinase FixL